MAKKKAKAKATAAKKPMTKSELLNAICDETELTRREVGSVLDALNTQIAKSLGRRGAGAFTLPGLVKIEKKKVPARKARKGSRHQHLSSCPLGSRGCRADGARRASARACGAARILPASR